MEHMNQLRYYREKAHLSQSQLAAKVGISARTVQDYEQDRKPLQGARAITVLNMARCLDCTVADLITISDRYIGPRPEIKELNDVQRSYGMNAIAHEMDALHKTLIHPANANKPGLVEQLQRKAKALYEVYFDLRGHTGIVWGIAGMDTEEQKFVRQYNHIMYQTETERIE